MEVQNKDKVLVNSFHDKAMNYCESVFFANRQDKKDDVAKYQKLAFLTEKKAIDILLKYKDLPLPEIEPTLSIMLHSCAILAYEHDKVLYKSLIKEYCEIIIKNQIVYVDEAKELLKSVEKL